MIIYDQNTNRAAQVFTFQVKRWVQSEHSLFKEPSRTAPTYTKVSRKRLKQAEGVIGASFVLGVMDPRIGGDYPSPETMKKIKRDLNAISELLKNTSIGIFEVI